MARDVLLVQMLARMRDVREFLTQDFSRAGVGVQDAQTPRSGAIPYGSARRSQSGGGEKREGGTNRTPHGVREGEISDGIAWKKDWQERHKIARPEGTESSPSTWLPKAPKSKSPWTAD